MEIGGFFIHMILHVMYSRTAYAVTERPLSRSNAARERRLVW